MKLISKLLRPWRRSPIAELPNVLPASFRELTITVRRCNNIVGGHTNTHLDSSILTTPDRALANALIKYGWKFWDSWYRGTYYDSMNALACITPYITNLFDEEMIMSTDMDIRNNRLSMLKYFTEMGNSIADFSKIVLTEEDN